MLFLLNTKQRIKNKPQAVLQQRETDCGAACFASVLKFYGVKKINLSVVHELLRSGRDGTNFEQLGETFQQIGIESLPVETTLSLLQARFEISNNKYSPTILHWKGNHFVVLYGFNKRGAVIADPAIGVYTITLEEFSEKWTKYALLLEKTDNFKPEQLHFQSPSAWDKFLPIVKLQKNAFIKVFLLAIFLQFLALVHPIGMKNLFDGLIAEVTTNVVDIILSGLLAVILVESFFQFIRSMILTRAEQRLGISMKEIFYEHLFKLPIAYFNRQRTGDLITLNGDTGTIGQLLAGRTLVAALDLLTFITYFTLLCYLQVKLVGLAICLIPVYSIAVFISAKFLQKLYRLNFAKSAELSSYTMEHLAGINTIKALAIEDSVWLKIQRLIISLQENQIKTTKVSLISSGVNSFFLIGGQTLVFWYGIHLVQGGELSVGSLVAFISVLGGLLRPAGSLVNLWNDIQQSRLASERLGTFFATKIELAEVKSDDHSINTIPPRIEINDLSYQYHGAGKYDFPALSNINLTFESGKTYGLIGASGSGKSTLGQLLVRFDDPVSGWISYNGKDIRLIAPKKLRKEIGYFSQDVYLFNTSIRENIAYGERYIDEDKILKCAELVGASEFINKLPRKFETVLSERGMGLSGGQRQRIALARMLYREPKLLILDEATSSLDLASEEIIYQNLETFFKERTVIIISHREETLKYVDCIIKLNEGNILQVISKKDEIELFQQYFTRYKSK